MCGSVSTVAIEPVATRSDGLFVVKCGDCGLLHVNPRPSTQELEKYYADGSAEDQMGAGYLARMDGTVSRGYYKCLEIAPLPSHREKALDIACAAGHAMFCLQRRGWEVSGIELSSDLAEAARRRFGFKDVFSSRSLDEITDWLQTKGPFHFMSMLDIVEHVENIPQFLEFYGRHLAPGGSILISTPNWPANAPAEILPNLKVLHLSVILEHLSYLSIEDIRRLATKLNLEVAKWGTYGPSIFSDAAMGRFTWRRRIRQRLERVPFFSRIYWRLRRSAISTPPDLYEGDGTHLYMYIMLRDRRPAKA
jgi:2-polyprenyl-3-methyl-5-hydroxy-6-metoxy-1,4-benzoquinol methylase